MSAIGPKETWTSAPETSAYDPKRTSVFALKMSVFGRIKRTSGNPHPNLFVRN